MVVMLNQCCCGCTLKTGTIILGVLNAIGGGGNVIYGITAAAVSDYVQGDFKDVLIGVGAAGAVFGVIMLLVAICLIIGAQTGNPALLLPWMVFTIIFIIAITIFYIIIAVVFFNMGFPANGAIFIVIAILYILLEIYFLLVVYSLYRQLKGTAPSFTA